MRVLALEVGDTSDLPGNVDWVELGRTGAVGRYLRYRGAVRRAFSEGFDGLLTHMVPRYSTLAAGWARRAGAPHYLWYTHKGVDGRLLRAIERVDGVFTASEESLRVDTPKRIVTGHGIDADHFDVARRAFSDGPGASGGGHLLSVGRLTPAKDPECVLDAVARLRAEGRAVELTWAGGGLAVGGAGRRRTGRGLAAGWRQCRTAGPAAGRRPAGGGPAGGGGLGRVLYLSGLPAADSAVDCCH